MTKFAYNNAKNANTSYTSFELNCGYHPYVTYKEDVNLCSKSKSANEFLVELKELMTIYHENLYHAQELQKQAHNKSVKSRSYTLSNKVWLNRKYIKTKCNCKLETKFFNLFQVLHLIEKQAYKLKLPKKWKISNILYLSLLE